MSNKLLLYVHTDDELELIHEISCYSTMANFYEVGYKTASGTFGTLTSTIYQVTGTFEGIADLKNL